jgi:hypothetical protein
MDNLLADAGRLEDWLRREGFDSRATTVNALIGTVEQLEAENERLKKENADLRTETMDVYERGGE